MKQYSKRKYRNTKRSLKVFYTKKRSGLEKLSKWSKNKYLRSYLAGQIEGDGTIYVPKNQSYSKKSKTKRGNVVFKNQKNYPTIRICFPARDYPLAQKLQSVFGGSVEWSKHKTYLILKFQSIESVYMVAYLINGYMRTPKIKKFESLVNFGNRNLGNNMKVKKQCKSSLGDDAWQTGFTEADSNFSISITVRNKKTGNLRVQPSFNLEISTKMNFKLHKFDQNIYETKEFLTDICNFFGGTIYYRERFNKKMGKTYTSHNMKRFNANSLKKVCDYYHKFPFKGSKHLNFTEWARVVMMPKPLDREGKQRCQDIRKNYNSTRTVFSWDHLESWDI